VRARRRLPVIAGMALSAVIIAAPAAQADTVNPKQDCKRVEIEGPHGTVFSLASLIPIGVDLLSGGILNDSLNCSNFLNDLAILSPQARVGSSNVDSFKDESDHGDHGDHKKFDHRFYHRRDYKDFDYKDFDHKHFEHKDFDHHEHHHRHKDDKDHKDHKDHHRRHHRHHRTAATAPTARTAPTAPTAPTARVRR
jgi:hypothetical protein